MIRTLKITALILTVIGTSYAFTAWQIVRFESNPQLRKADYIIVLGAALQHGQPSPVFKARLDHARDLYYGGFAAQIMLTGGTAVGQLHSEAEAGRNYLLTQSIPNAALLVETQSTTTWENLLFAKQLLQSTAQPSYIIVSDPLHLKRAIDMSHSLQITAQPAGTPYSRYVSWQTKKGFLMREAFFCLYHAITGH